MEEAVLLANSMKSVRFRENGHAAGYKMQKDFCLAHLPVSTSVPMQPPTMNFGITGMISSKMKVPNATILSKVDTINSSGMYPESFAVQASAGMATGFRRSPVSQPVRHLGPPPGFTSAPPKQVTESFSGLDLTTENPLANDYSWLDGYHLPPSTKTSGFSGSTSLSSYPTLQYASINNGSIGADNFPFPAKQLPGSQVQLEQETGWENFQAFENLRAQQDQHLQQQQLLNGNQQFTTTPVQFDGHSM